jgi:hypothetical protein
MERRFEENAERVAIPGCCTWPVVSAHRCGANENPATGSQRRPVHHAAAFQIRNQWNQIGLARVQIIDRAAPALLGGGPVIIDTRSDGSTPVQLVR